MKIAFHIYTFSFRGTEIATYDYAHFSETILGNQSIIVAPKKIHQNNHQQTIEKFVSRFPLYLYDDMENLEKYLIKEKVDAMYVIKYGLKDEVELKNIPMLIHCVYKIEEPHGLVYAGVSESISSKNVSHIVNIPKNPSFSKDILRKKMNIPNDAIVFGRSGGLDSFFLEGVKETIVKILGENSDKNECKNIYFLFMPRPYLLNDVPESNRIRYLPSTSDLQVKRDFIEVCDAMLHAQILGETQGLSVLEFSYCNKPVITWNGGQVKQHLKNLGDKAIKYNDEKELYSILTNFNSVYEEKNKVLKGNWRVTEKFSPKHIMKQFDKVFLEPVRNLSVKNLL